MIENEHVYCTVKQLAEDKAFCFTESALRYYLLHAHKNGLNKAIRKLNRKVSVKRTRIDKFRKRADFVFSSFEEEVHQDADMDDS